jgi:DNA-binding CsgD family transcriptional regulator
MHSLNLVVPFEVSFMASADPGTLLFTRALADNALVTSAPQFLDNEFGVVPDVNRFAGLAQGVDPVASLDDATSGDRTVSPRWRDIMSPIGMGDELRVAMRVDRTTWGYLCLHRSGPLGFSATEMAVLRFMAPHAGEALRRGATATSENSDGVTATEGTESVILAENGIVLAVAGEFVGLEDEPLQIGQRLPIPLAAVARRLEAIESSDGGAGTLPPAAIRMTARSGALVTVHASRLRYSSGDGPVVLTVVAADAVERSSFLLAVHGLTPAQCRVAVLVLQGRTTAQIVENLSISPHTVQDHLKAVFDKVGVRSRRELVSAMMNPSQ